MSEVFPILGDQPEWGGLEGVTPIDPHTFLAEITKEDLAVSLLERGYAVIRLPRDVMYTYDAFSRSLDTFFQQPLEEKARFATMMDNQPQPFSPNQFHGYSKLHGLKEQFMIRGCGHGSSLIFPGGYPVSGNSDAALSPHFGALSLTLLEQLDIVCRQALYAVADHLSLPRSHADRILDPINQITTKADIAHPEVGNMHNTAGMPFHVNLKCSAIKTTAVKNDTSPHPAFLCSSPFFYPKYVSSCILDIFHYENTFHHEDQSFDKYKNNHLAHTDSGILTVVPCADVAGLELYDGKRKQWLAIEQLVHEAATDHREYATIFWGDSFEYMVKGHTEACLHRVAKSDKARHSIVYKQRTKPTVTAPRYQEDYELATIQQASLDTVRARKLFSLFAVGIVALGTFTFWYSVHTKK